MERQPKAVVALFASLRVADLSHVVDNATKPYPGDPATRVWKRRLTSRTTTAA